MGTVVTKLGGTIQPATQRRLATVLVSALQVGDSAWSIKQKTLQSH